MRDKPNIEIILRACRDQKLEGQRKLYELYYSYGMSVSRRYATDKGEAQHMLNDAFHKVFTKIAQYDSAYPFKQWFRTILIHACIDYQRKYKKLGTLVELADQNEILTGTDTESAYQHLLYEDVLKQIQKLPPAYKLIFNLYAIDGFKHHEIAEKLGISVNTSKSNYSRARKHLQLLLQKTADKENFRYGR